jgi:hypothetical protein
MVPKPDGTYRMCCDYRMLNDQTVKETFPLPHIDDCFDVLHGCSIYSSFDLSSAYYHIAVHPGSIAKTAIITKFGRFEFTCMPFGLTNAPATFARFITDVLNGILGRLPVVAFLDDVFFGSNTVQEHMQLARAILQRFREHSLRLKPSKLQIGFVTIKALGHILHDGKVFPDGDKLAALENFPGPPRPARSSSASSASPATTASTCPGTHTTLAR